MTAVTLVLTDGPDARRTATALALASALQGRGHRVAVYAGDEGVRITARGSSRYDEAATLIRRGVHGGTLDWVIDAQAADALGVGDRQAPGVLPGGPADLWGFVEAADSVLKPRQEGR